MAEGHPVLSNVDHVHIRWTHVPTQIGFVGHEAGHHQISASRQANDVIGLLYGDLAIGLSFGWSVDKHNRHHAHPNQEGKDPDIQTGALAFTAGKAGSWGPVARLMYRYQAYLFFPLLMLEAINLHVASIRALVRPSVRHRTWEQPVGRPRAAAWRLN